MKRGTPAGYGRPTPQPDQKQGAKVHSHANSTTLRSDTQAVSIDGPVEQVFDFLADPANLPKWAVGFCHSIRRDGDHWMVTTAGGEVSIRYVTDRELGVVDFYISPAPGIEAAAFSRVLPRGGGAEYVFTQFQAPGMPDEVFTGQVHALLEELRILQSLIRARAACSASAAN
jgi:uncharacterized membrane protein